MSEGEKRSYETARGGRNVFFATVGLEVSDFVYRRIALFVSAVSGIDSGFHLMHRHGHGGRQCTMRSAYTLLFIPFTSSKVIASFFRPPTSACMYTYSYFFTPGLYMGFFLALGNGPEHASYIPLFGLPMAMR